MVPSARFKIWVWSPDIGGLDSAKPSFVRPSKVFIRLDFVEPISKSPPKIRRRSDFIAKSDSDDRRRFIKLLTVEATEVVLAVNGLLKDCDHPSPL